LTPSGLHIARTIFGPTVYGKGLITAEKIFSSAYHAITALHEHSERKMLNKMFESEGLEISEEECHSDDKTHKTWNNIPRKLLSQMAPFPLKGNTTTASQLDASNPYKRRCNSLLKTADGILNYGKNLEEGTANLFPSTSNLTPWGRTTCLTRGSPTKVPLRIVSGASSKRRNKFPSMDVIHKGEFDLIRQNTFMYFISSRKGVSYLTRATSEAARPIAISVP
ncbi:hypothetical protein COOONC_25205, partial [Cooperia oncophora]